MKEKSAIPFYLSLSASAYSSVCIGGGLAASYIGLPFADKLLGTAIIIGGAGILPQIYALRRYGTENRTKYLLEKNGCDKQADQLGKNLSTRQLIKINSNDK